MLHWIKTVIENFSYPGLVFLMLLENVFPPIPSELIIPLAGFFTTQGQLSFVGVVIAGTTGSVLGAIALYYVGRRLGGDGLRRWCDAHGRWVGLSRTDLEKSDRWFARHGSMIVLFGRLVPGVRSLISIPAGAAQMNFGAFLGYTIVGSAAWTALLAFAGRMLGQNYERVEHVVGPISTGVVVVLLGWWLYRVIFGARREAH